MAITLAQAKALKRGDYVHTPKFTNSDGTPARWKVSGQVHTWAKSPERVRVPIKRGLKQYSHIDEATLGEFSLGDGLG